MRYTLPPLARERLTAWSILWTLPDLPDTIRVEVSARMRRALGRCDPRRGIVRLNPAVVDGSEDVLLETLCHEAAHVAAYRIHGRGIRPHGPEWAELMALAGYEARATVRGDRVPPAVRERAAPRWLYRHHCADCGAMRTAGRMVRRWRCRNCVDAGRSGVLEVVRVAATSTPRSG